MTMAAMPERTYVPAAGRDLFLRFYDPLTRLFGGRKIALALLEQASLQPHFKVLDVGCGTGTVAVLIKQLHPAIEITGLDPDPKALAIAAGKAARAGVAVRFDRGFADLLPYEDASFDRVFSSLMFHHVRGDDRPKVLAEIRRVLKPGGSLEFVDIAGHGHGFLVRLLHGQPAAPPPGEDRMLRRLREAGFADAHKVADRDTGFGPIAFYQARR
jgi:ubiquinone/menaquinone biosynthesis C-methylase UbiE